MPRRATSYTIWQQSHSNSNKANTSIFIEPPSQIGFRQIGGWYKGEWSQVPESIKEELQEIAASQNESNEYILDAKRRSTVAAEYIDDIQYLIDKLSATCGFEGFA